MLLLTYYVANIYRSILYDSLNYFEKVIWNKAFKSGVSKLCGRQPLKNFKGYGFKMVSKINFLKAIFHKDYLVHS